MTSTPAASAEAGAPPISDTWTWWQARRLRYNLALAASGVAAYLLALAFFGLFGEVPWDGWLAGTMVRALAFLVVMGVANICYLIGPLGEAWLKPAEPQRYRDTAYAMGFWGSVALPFVFPLAVLAELIASAG
jgi:hypothetical protein